jgi:hypothetical protein
LRLSADSLALVQRLAGHDVQAAHDGWGAVQAAVAFRPDVALLDTGMPKMIAYRGGPSHPAATVGEAHGSDRLDRLG